MWDKQKLDDAITRNIVFFHSKAVRKEITPWILAVMQSYSVDNNLGRPIKIIKKADCFFSDWSAHYKKIFGCDVVHLSDNKLMDYWLSQNCSLPSKKKSIFIVETDIGNYLVGSC